jgi:hypothetical protein
MHPSVIRKSLNKIRTIASKPSLKVPVQQTPKDKGQSNNGRPVLAPQLELAVTITVFTHAVDFHHVCNLRVTVSLRASQHFFADTEVQAFSLMALTTN